VYDWIDTTIHRVSEPYDGAIVMVDSTYTEMSRLNFYSGVITEIIFPALDAGSKDPARISLKITPKYTRYVAGTGVKWSPQYVKAVGGKTSLLLPWAFRLQIDKLDCNRVNTIDALTITPLIGESTGFQTNVRSEKEPVSLEVPNLGLTLAESDTDGFRAWHGDSVIKGIHTTKNGTLEYLDSNLKDVLFTLTFQNLGIFKLSPEKYEGESGSVRRSRAEMYCEAITFQGKSAATDFVPPQAPPPHAPPPQAPPPSFPGTRPSIPRYAQPFATVGNVFQPKISPDTTVKFEKEAPVQYTKGVPVPDEVTVPLRLGRPLKFRS